MKTDDVSGYVFYDIETLQPLAVQPVIIAAPCRPRRRTTRNRLVEAAELGAAFLRGDIIAPELERRRRRIANAVATIIEALDALDPDPDLEENGDEREPWAPGAIN